MATRNCINVCRRMCLLLPRSEVSTHLHFKLQQNARPIHIYAKVNGRQKTPLNKSFLLLTEKASDFFLESPPSSKGRADISESNSAQAFKLGLNPPFAERAGINCLRPE